MSILILLIQYIGVLALVYWLYAIISRKRPGIVNEADGLEHQAVPKKRGIGAVLMDILKLIGFLVLALNAILLFYAVSRVVYEEITKKPNLGPEKKAADHPLSAQEKMPGDRR